MIGLGLNGPQFARPCARDDVDSRVNTPPVRPVFPQPDFIELTSIPWSIFEEPFAQPLEVAAETRAVSLATNKGFDLLKPHFCLDQTRIVRSTAPPQALDHQRRLDVGCVLRRQGHAQNVLANGSQVAP